MRTSTNFVFRLICVEIASELPCNAFLAVHCACLQPLKHLSYAFCSLLAEAVHNTEFVGETWQKRNVRNSQEGVQDEAEGGLVSVREWDLR